MAEKDKYADEKLSDEELDKVAGGTVTESDELQVLFPTRKKTRYSQHVRGGTYEFEIIMDYEEIEGWLKSNLNIDAKLNYWHFWPWQDGDPNTYSRNGQSMSHEQVVKEVKAKLGIA